MGVKQNLGKTKEDLRKTMRCEAKMDEKAQHTREYVSISSPFLTKQRAFCVSPIEISFEVFPPRSTEGNNTLLTHCQSLMTLKPGFISVTYGAGGSTREQTPYIVQQIQQQTQCIATPHISCIGSRIAEINSLLTEYKEMGITQLVTLRGDLPSGVASHGGDFKHASDLVRHIREHYRDHFKIYVAGYPEKHPESRTMQNDLCHFKQKIEAGADSAITQYFFNADAFLDWRDRCQKMGIHIPLIPGIMPITQLAGLQRFSLLCGTEIPRWLENRLNEFADDHDSLQAFAIEFVSRLCERLIKEDVPGLHFYTLNKSAATLAICRNLGLIAVMG